MVVRVGVGDVSAVGNVFKELERLSNSFVVLFDRLSDRDVIKRSFGTLVLDSLLALVSLYECIGTKSVYASVT